MSGNRDIKLKVPIQHGTSSIEVLTIRKPKAKELRPIPLQPNYGDLLNLAAVLSGQPASVIDKLEVEDAMEVIGVVGGFFPDSPATGG